MLLSNQQKYILEILKEFKYLRVRQLHALVQAHYRTQGIKIDERRSPDFTRKTDCMNPFSCALPETEREPDTFSAWHGWTPLLTLQPFPV